MGLLPDALTHTRLTDFIPVDSLAETIVDIVHDRVDNAGDTNPAIYNLVNPKPVPFAELIPTITSHLSHRGSEVKPVSMQEWFGTLKSHDVPDKEALTKYPSLKLMGFWEAMAESIGSHQGEEGIDTSNGCRISRAMREMKPVSGEDVIGWMENWGI